jgi:hypothetical protein
MRSEPTASPIAGSVSRRARHFARWRINRTLRRTKWATPWRLSFGWKRRTHIEPRCRRHGSLRGAGSDRQRALPMKDLDILLHGRRWKAGEMSRRDDLSQAREQHSALSFSVAAYKLGLRRPDPARFGATAPPDPKRRRYRTGAIWFRDCNRATLTAVRNSICVNHTTYFEMQ